MSTHQREVYSISRLNAELHQVLKSGFPPLWVEGEISNLTLPRSGHVYFSLKDHYAQVRCAFFRQKRLLLRQQLPENGDQVLVRARIALYEPRGDCQLIVEQIQPAGAGQAQQALERLKRKLHAEGLSDPSRKLPLPPFPRQIGLITSPSGAALRDILQILKRRFPCTSVLIYPTLVQGADAPAGLNCALQSALDRAECDVLILTRGGGAQEDLAAFNDEQLARRIAAGRIPVVSAVGHEIDVTLVDFVADQRAPTPSAAAELVTPESQQLLASLIATRQRLQQLALHTIQSHQTILAQWQQRLQQRHPANRLLQQQQRLDELHQRLLSICQRQQQHTGIRLTHARQRLWAQNPQHTLHQTATQISHWQQRLHTAYVHILQQQTARWRQAAVQLHAFSPLATLQRGYSIARIATDKRIIRRASQVKSGDDVTVELAEGSLSVRVQHTIESILP
jgi:exodeoxyribonuclease VII large subunit